MQPPYPEPGYGSPYDIFRTFLEDPAAFCLPTSRLALSGARGRHVVPYLAQQRLKPVSSVSGPLSQPHKPLTVGGDACISCVLTMVRISAG